MRLFHKLFCFGIAILSIAPIANAQKLNLSDIRSMTRSGSGSITQSDEILGYYYMYQLDRKSNKERVYSIKLTDANLEVLQEKTLTRKRGTRAIGAKYNGESICLTLLNSIDRSLELITFDREGEQLGTKTFELERRAFSALVQQYGLTEEDANVSLVRPVPNKGFVVYLPTATSGLGYDMHYLPSDLSSKGSWKKPHVAKHGKFQSALNLSATDEVILTSISAQKSRMSVKGSIEVIEGRNVKDGKLLFEFIPGKGSPRMSINNGFYEPETNTFMLAGMYYNPGDDLIKDESIGLALQRVDMNGERLENTKMNWTRGFGKVGRSKTAHLKKGGSVYIHRALTGKDGQLTLIGEYYDDEVSALGVAGAVLGGGNSNVSMKKIVLQDLFTFTFDKQLEFVDAEILPKDKRSVELPAGYALIAPARLALMLDMLDWFDYSYAQSFPEQDMYTIAYRALVQEKGKLFRQPNLVLLTKYGDQEEPAQKQIDLRTKATYVSYQPAKPGYVMVSEYFRKDKTLSSRLERLD